MKTILPIRTWALAALMAAGQILFLDLSVGHGQDFEPGIYSTGRLDTELTGSGRVFPSRDPEALILEYYIIGSAPSDALTPHLQIFGNGHVRVHRPNHWARPGDYTIELTIEEIDALMESLAAWGVMDFDKASLDASVRTALEEHVAQTGVHPFLADGSVISIEVRLELYIPRDGGEPVENLHHRFSWADPDHASSLFPKVRAIQDLSRATKELNALAERASRGRRP